MEEFIRYVKQTLLKLLSLALLGISFLMITGNERYLSGWLTGCAINLLYFVMLCSRSLRALKMNPQRAFLMLRSGAFVRILMIVLMLVIVLHFPFINIWAVLAGIMTYRFLVYFDAIYAVFRRQKKI